MNKVKPFHIITAVFLTFLLTLRSHATQAFNPQQRPGDDNYQWLAGFHLPGANFDVQAIVNDGTNVYVSGGFTRIGNQPVNGIARYDGNSWTSLSSGNSGGINTLLWADGNLYAGGTFTSVDGVPANYIARWDGSSWHPLGVGLGSFVHALAWDGINLYAGGTFLMAGGVTAKRVARWDGSNWSAMGTGTSGGVDALAWDGSNLFASGSFTSAGGNSANRVARWDGVNWYALGTGTNSRTTALYADGSDLYVGGKFSTAGGVPANGIAKWDGGSWSALGSGVIGPFPELNSITKYNGDLYVGGRFVTAGGTEVNNIARWDGSSWHALDTGTSHTVLALNWIGNALYAVGRFTIAGDAGAVRIAKWENNDWSAVTNGNGMDDEVWRLEWSGTDLYASGEFIAAGNIVANGIARWDGNQWSPLGTGFDVNNVGIGAMVWANGNLYAGGGFTEIGGTPANYIARWDGANWHSLGSGLSKGVNTLAWDGANLFAGGNFITAGGVPANYVARWDGANWFPLGSGLDMEPNDMVIGDGKLFVGGYFSTAGGNPANNIAYWDGSNWFPLGSGLNGPVHSLAWDGQNLYAAGFFNDAGGISVLNIAKWDGSSWSALGSGIVLFGNDSIQDLVWNGKDLYAMGRFFTAGGQSIEHIARWDGFDWYPLDNANVTNFNAGVWADDRLFVGGDLSSAGNYPSENIAVWGPGPDFTLDVIPPNIVVCPGNDAVYSIDLSALNNYNDSVTLNASGHPSGTSAVFAQNPITPPDSTTVTISDTAAATPGNYSIDIIGVATTRTHTTTVGLDVLNPPPTLAPTLLTPANGATNVPNQPTFSWTAVATANQYILEVATDNVFSNIVYTKTIAGTSHMVDAPLANGTEHFWRVTAQNLCGSSPTSTIFSFTTAQLVPDVGVTPGSFNVTLEEGASTNETLTISNSGTADLIWSLTEDQSGACSNPNDIPWLTLSSTGGTINPSQNTDITLTFDATGLSEGIYNGSICLASNDPDTALINIPVTLQVEVSTYFIYLPAVLSQ